MDQEENFKEVINEFFSAAKAQYGDAVEKFWFYEIDTCPCCSKRKIDHVSMGKELAMSLNAFMYRDMSVLIGYLLCSHCITDLLGASKQQKIMYNRIEQNLKNAYHNYLKSLAS